MTSADSSRMVLRMLGAMLAVAASVTAAWSQETTQDKRIEYPLQVFNAAGVDRLLQKAEAVFSAAERLEIVDVLDGWLQNSLAGLKGMDRTKPFGMMIYIKPGLNTGLTAVMYFPVTDADEFLQVLAQPKGAPRPISGKPNRFEIRDRGFGPDLAARVIGDYMFVVDINDDDNLAELDRTFPDPQRLAGKLTSRYDIAYSLLLKNIPPAMKTLFLEFFKNQALAGLQQRDDEPDAAYRLRRANGESLLELIDKVVNQGEELTVGGMVDAERRSGLIEFELNGTKDSKLAKFFQDMAGRKSYFAPLTEESATLTMNVSWQFSEKQRKVFTELFTLAPTEFEKDLKKDHQVEGAGAVVGPICQTLLRTAEQGHLDFFLQLAGEEPLDYRVIGGVRVQSNSAFPGQLVKVLEFVKNTGVGPLTLFKSLELNARTIGDHPVHLLPLPAPDDDAGKAMFGEAPRLYLHANPQSLWFAVGGDSALEKLEAAIRKVTDPPSSDDQPKRPTVPFLLVTHARQWVNVGLAAGADAKDDDFAPLHDSFQDDDDELRISGRPTDQGTRLRAEFQSGFLGWLGRSIAGEVDESLK